MTLLWSPFPLPKQCQLLSRGEALDVVKWEGVAGVEVNNLDRQAEGQQTEEQWAEGEGAEKEDAEEEWAQVKHVLQTAAVFYSYADWLLWFKF